MSSRTGSPANRRRVPVPQNSEQYVAVPQAPYSPPRSRPAPSPSFSGRPPYSPFGSGASRTPSHNPSRDIPNDTAQGVASHNIGGGFGPYAHHLAPGRNSRPPSGRRNPPLNRDYRDHSSSVISDKPLPTSKPYTSATPPVFLWDQKDNDLDPLHDADPARDDRLDNECDPFSGRGWANMVAVCVIIGALVVLFAAYPIITYYTKNHPRSGGYNLGGINGSGQVPDLPNIPSLIDKQTPDSALHRTGYDKKKYNLVFSDEFNRDGRTFWPGDDPWWEAVDLHYWATDDLEWYAPDAITTANGNLVITMTEQLNHDLNWRSGMLQSWNKFCFSSGYIEVNISLPGTPRAAGLWPGAWTMGNLGRAGYGASTEGMWPYSYDACDVGTFPAQQDKNGNPTNEVLTGKTNGEVLSQLPGQKLSACTCPGSDHPGPSVSRGRGVPEIDIIEAQIDPTRWQGEASQSVQIAPFNALYAFDNTSDATTIYNTTQTKFNTYKGGTYQQAVSAVSDFPNTGYGGQGYNTYGFEFWGNRDDRPNTYITWFVNGVPTWTVTSQSLAGDSVSGISNRLVSEEPMYIILNLGMAFSFQHQDFANLKFPAQMLVDYVRVYQRAGSENYGCNPADHPTTDYIADHPVAYLNPNATTWAQANYTFPRNSVKDGCT